MLDTVVVSYFAQHSPFIKSYYPLTNEVAKGYSNATVLSVTSL
jgi:hypothetical protein